MYGINTGLRLAYFSLAIRNPRSIFKHEETLPVLKIEFSFFVNLYVMNQICFLIRYFRQREKTLSKQFDLFITERIWNFYNFIYFFTFIIFYNIRNLEQINLNINYNRYLNVARYRRLKQILRQISNGTNNVAFITTNFRYVEYLVYFIRSRRSLINSLFVV